MSDQLKNQSSWLELMQIRHIINFLLIFLIVIVAVIWAAEPFLMPGTQPETIGALQSASTCGLCHGGYNPEIEPAFTWSGSMMANAARDPVFYAALTIAEQDNPEAGDFCLRCHSPVGWLEGRSKPGAGASLTAKDREGIQCDFCHQLVDPLSEEGKALVEPDVPGRGSAMYVVSPGVKRGPYDDARSIHRTAKSDFHLSGDLCGTCHNVSNPFFASDVTTQSPHEYGVIERTYSEWLLSDYSKMGHEGSCQGCHMARTTGYGTRQRIRLRDDLAIHDLTGGNTWVPDTLPLIWGDEVNEAALAATKQRAIATLRRAATLDLVFPDDDTLNVRITNETGHKLPTGYPEGRRMWLNVKFFNATGTIISESGRYEFIDDELKGTPVRVPTILADNQLKVYETKPGLSEAWAAEIGLEAGPSSHFVLNDMIYKDNRIPPRGFTNAAFASHSAQPVAYSYQDGQFWDNTPYRIPEGAVEVEVTLYYQTASWEYIKFLVEENRTNDWGDRLYDVWTRTEFSPPVAMNMIRERIETQQVFPAWDANQNGVVDILDLVIVASHFGESPPKDARADVNKDNVVNILDLVLVARHFGERTISAAPNGAVGTVTPEQRAILKNLSLRLAENPRSHPDFTLVQNLIHQLLSDQPGTEPLVAFSNYPNPANPETWLPYQLNDSADVFIQIYNSAAHLVRTLNLGHQEVGVYRDRNKAAYWDGRDSHGESVASGIYFYVIQADDVVKAGKLTIIR